MSRKTRQRRKKRALRKQEHECPHCGAMKTGRRCHSPACVALRNTPTKYASNWQRWGFVGLLTRRVSLAVIAQARKDGDKKFGEIGERAHRWTNQACDEAQQFPVSVQYATAQQTRYDREVVKIWPSKSNIHLAHLVEVSLRLIHDLIDHFKAQGFTPVQLKSWNWAEAAFKKLQDYYTADEMIEHCERAEQDYTAFSVSLLGMTPEKEKPLFMWSVSERFAVAAHNKDEAEKIVHKHYGLTGLKATQVVPTTKIMFNGQWTTYGALLELFNVPGIVADMKEAA